MPLLSRRPQEPPKPQQHYVGRRAMVGSASVVNIGDKTEAARLSKTRQAWQTEAWMYRRTLPELRYAVAYIGNACMRMRLFPAVAVEDHEVPIPADSPEAAFPPDMVQAAHDILSELRSGGPLALPLLLKRLGENFEVAGECFLVGEPDTLTTQIKWSIRSVNEMWIKGEKYGIREVPGSGGGDQGVRWLPEGSFVARLWWPDPEFAYLADSPVQSVREVCEELLLLSREVRALARNRLANSGLLLLSDELSVVSEGRRNGQTDVDADDDTDDDDPFFRELIDGANAALTNEGAASSVVPIIARGPAQAIQNGVRYMSLQRPLLQHNAAARQEVIARMATGLDLPSEVLTGKADINHWGLWAISDDTFRHHIEPIVIVMCDALTAGYLWPRLEAIGKWDSAQIRQMLLWYDPTELVTHPDRSQDAFQAWDRLAISDKALRGYLGFPDDDAPLPQEILIRLSTHVRALDPALQTAILKLLDPKLQIPGLTSAQPGQPALPAGDAAPAPPPGNPAPIGNNTGPPATGGAAGEPPPAPPAVAASAADGSLDLLSAKQKEIIHTAVMALRGAGGR